MRVNLQLPTTPQTLGTGKAAEKSDAGSTLPIDFLFCFSRRIEIVGKLAVCNGLSLLRFELPNLVHLRLAGRTCSVAAGAAGVLTLDV